MSKIILENLIVAHLIKNLSDLHGTQRFITVFKIVRLQNSYPEYGGSMFLRIVGKHAQACKASQPRRPQTTWLTVKYNVILTERLFEADFPSL
jgi:hypothetical protein